MRFFLALLCPFFSLTILPDSVSCFETRESIIKNVNGIFNSALDTIFQGEHHSRPISFSRTTENTLSRSLDLRNRIIGDSLSKFRKSAKLRAVGLPIGNGGHYVLLHPLPRFPVRWIVSSSNLLVLNPASQYV